MSHSVLLTDLPDEILLRIFTYVADLLDFEDSSEKSPWSTQIIGPLRLPARSLVGLSRVSHRFNRVAKPLLFRTLKITGREGDGSVSVVKLLNAMLNSEGNLGRKVRNLWLGPWKPSGSFEGVDIFNRRGVLRHVTPLPCIEDFARRNVIFLDSGVNEQWIQNITVVDEDALLALFLSMLHRLETLELVTWFPSFIGYVFRLLSQWTVIYNAAIPQEFSTRPFSNLRRVTFHEYCWGEDYTEDSGSEGWSDHEDEIVHEFLTIDKLVPFFCLPSVRVLECREVTSRNTHYETLELPVGCSGVEELSFKRSSLDDRILQVMLSACKGLKSFHFLATGERFGFQLFTYPGLGQALECQANTLTKLYIHTDNLFSTNNGREQRHTDVSTIGSSLLSLTKLSALEVPGTLLWGYHPEAVFACETQKNSPLFIDLSPFANLMEILPRSLERFCVNEWYKNIDKGMEDFARCCGKDRVFKNMRSLEVGLGDTEMLEEICRVVGVQLVKHSDPTRSGICSPNRPR
jgi:hypothetical protein